MNADQLRGIVQKHALWLAGEPGGVRFDLQGADLHGADLHGADLHDADLHDADLWRANLHGADLHDANLHGANLWGTDLDYACWPLWCGSRGARVDARIAAQLAAHFCALDCDDPAYIAARSAMIDFARTSHRADDLGLTVGKP